MKLQRRPVFSLLAAATDIKSAAPRAAELTEHFRVAHFFSTQLFERGVFEPSHLKTLRFFHGWREHGIRGHAKEI